MKLMMLLQKMDIYYKFLELKIKVQIKESLQFYCSMVFCVQLIIGLIMVNFLLLFYWLLQDMMFGFQIQEAQNTPENILL